MVACSNPAIPYAIPYAIPLSHRAAFAVGVPWALGSTWHNAHQSDRRSRACGNCDMVVPKSAIGNWERIRNPTDKCTGENRREYTCQYVLEIPIREPSQEPQLSRIMPFNVANHEGSLCLQRFESCPDRGCGYRGVFVRMIPMYDAVRYRSDGSPHYYNHRRDYESGNSGGSSSGGGGGASW